MQRNIEDTPFDLGGCSENKKNQETHCRYNRDFLGRNFSCRDFPNKMWKKTEHHPWAEAETAAVKTLLSKKIKS
ncbi:hypothetical protein LSH36_553g01048 [Paralvinella palmiformis]|uniref:Uncharacterized protein n=1 Tax=Paralvinella palmiformis TaxID=53620 RepID=A0AAD9J790_9ANNE|nr:hypothetical protein LSH36_553g01048 [Paralvinella palmiformis]